MADIKQLMMEGTNRYRKCHGRCQKVLGRHCLWNVYQLSL